MRLKLLVYMGVVVFNAFSAFVATQVVPSADTLIRTMTAAGDGLVVLLALSSLVRAKRFHGVHYFLVFLVLSTLTYILNSFRVDLITHANGLRQPLYFLAAIVVTNDLLCSEYRERFIKQFTVFLVIFGIAQIPTSAWQFAQFGAGDAVGGTFGLSGGSGWVTQLVFLIAFYLSVRYGSTPDGEAFRLNRIILFSLLLTPCILNETKVAFVLLFLFMLIIALSRRQIYRFVPIAAFGALLVYVAASYYSEHVTDVQRLLDEEFLERYLVYDPRPGMDIPRFQKIVLMLSMMRDDLVAVVFGYGYGLFGGRNLLGTSDFMRSLWYFGGTRVFLNTIWIQGGILGVALFLLSTFSFVKTRLLESVNMKKARMFLVLCIALVWVYNDAFFARTYANVITFLMYWVFSGGEDYVEAEEMEELDEEIGEEHIEHEQGALVTVEPQPHE